jgi:hypothetical protein
MIGLTVMISAMGMFVVSRVEAGLKGGVGVTVSTATSEFWGSLGKARGSSDSLQYIGCQSVVRQPNHEYERITCEAMDQWGNYDYCQYTDVWNYMSRALNKLNGGSTLYVRYVPSHYCDYISVANYSIYPPTAP